MHRNKPTYEDLLNENERLKEQVADLEDVFLYTVDDLQSIIAKNMENRRKAALEAEAIVNKQTSGFMSWLRGLNTQDTVVSYRNQCMEERDLLLEKAKQQLQNNRDPEAVIAELAIKLTNKFMHAPTNAIQSAAQGGELDKLVYLRDIFNIDK